MLEILTALVLTAGTGSSGGDKLLGSPGQTATGEKSGASGEADKVVAPPEKAMPPELTADGLREELRRAARERKAQAAKLTDERTKLAQERTQLEQMAKDIEGARQSLRTETQDLRQEIKKKPSPGAAAGPDGKPTPTPLDTVAKTLKNMRPEVAAQVLTHVERSLAVGVLGRMRPSDAGAVLEKMKPEQAAQFLAALAGEERTAGQEQRHE